MATLFLPFIYSLWQCDSVAPFSNRWGLLSRPLNLGWLVTCFDQHYTADVTLCHSESRPQRALQYSPPQTLPCLQGQSA